MTNCTNKPTPANHPGESQWLKPEYEPGLVSVIIPTYNRADLICETLDSVAVQTYRPIELIVVDDGSTDNSLSVIRDWFKTSAALKDFSCKLIQQRNAGAPVARNRGAAESKGEFIQFFDSDDVMGEEKIESQVQALMQTRKEWSGCLYTRFSGSADSGRLCVPYDGILSLTPAKNVILGALCAQVGIYRRNFLRKIGPWNPLLRIMQDTEFCYRVLTSGSDGAWVPRILAHVRNDGASIMRRSFAAKSGDILSTIHHIETVARANDSYDLELQANFGKMLSLCYRQLLVNEDCKASMFLGEAEQRCVGMSLLKLRVVRLLAACRFGKFNPGLTLLRRVL
jgi:glycosyltransferase involved in cell wall biosynthesis